MKIAKIFNNNTVATISQDKTEMIVTGPGIGFHKAVGDQIDERKIEKRYLIENTQRTRFYQMLENIPVEYFEFSEIIFKKEMCIRDRYTTSMVSVNIWEL